jgi:hypothetical protein
MVDNEHDAHGAGTAGAFPLYPGNCLILKAIQMLSWIHANTHWEWWHWEIFGPRSQRSWNRRLASAINSLRVDAIFQNQAVACRFISLSQAAVTAATQLRRHAHFARTCKGSQDHAFSQNFGKNSTGNKGGP